MKLILILAAILASVTTPDPPPVDVTVHHGGGEIEVDEGADLTLLSYLPIGAEPIEPSEGWECIEGLCAFDYGMVLTDDTVPTASYDPTCSECHDGHGPGYNGFKFPTIFIKVQRRP